MSLGNRDEMLTGLITNLRRYSALPIRLYTDVSRSHLHLENVEERRVAEEELRWRDHERWAIRNTNVISAKAALNGPFDSCCILNDDMRIADPGWVDGFRLAERFGCCVPMNPRIYVGVNAMGADAGDKDYNEMVHGPYHGPACNVSPMFACRRLVSAQTLLTAYLQELDECMRGTLAFWRASWRTGITPMYLPEQWCVCGSSAGYLKDYHKVLRGKPMPIECMMLHWGQAGVKAAFKGMK